MRRAEVFVSARGTRQVQTLVTAFCQMLLDRLAQSHGGQGLERLAETSLVHEVFSRVRTGAQGVEPESARGLDIGHAWKGNAVVRRTAASEPFRVHLGAEQLTAGDGRWPQGETVEGAGAIRAAVKRRHELRGGLPRGGKDVEDGTSLTNARLDFGCREEARPGLRGHHGRKFWCFCPPESTGRTHPVSRVRQTSSISFVATD